MAVVSQIVQPQGCSSLWLMANDVCVQAVSTDAPAWPGVRSLPKQQERA